MATKTYAEMLDAVLQFVNSKGGQHLTSKQIAAHFSVGSSCIGRYLTELSRDGFIQATGSTHVRVYSKVMPSTETAPVEAAQPKGVLKIDRHRRALYAELAAARAAIPSIG